MPSIETITLPNGAAAGRVLTSDANGVGTWQAATGGGGGATVNAAAARATAAGASVSAAGWLAIPLPTALTIEPSDAFTVSGNAVTVKEAGWYDVSAGIWNGAAAAATIFAALSTSATVADGDIANGSSTSGYSRVTVSGSVKLAAGGKVYLHGYNPGSVSLLCQSFSIVRVGGPKGDKGDTGAAGGTMGAATAYSLGWGSQVALASWATLPSQEMVSEPLGAFTKNGDHSITVNEAGWYDVQATVYGTGGGAWHFTVGSAPNVQGNYAEGYSGAAGILAAAAAVKLAAGARLYVCGSGAGSGQIRNWTVARLGGPQGVKGDTGGNATVPIEAWHTVGAAGEPAFQNGWVGHAASGMYAPKFRKRPDGMVELDGMLRGGTINQPAFTLPVGYRPYATTAGSLYIPISISGKSDVGFLTISDAGLVMVTNSAGQSIVVGDWCALGAIQFSTDQATFPSGPQGPKGDPGPWGDMYAQLAQATSRPRTAMPSQVWTLVPVPPTLTITSSSGSPDFTRNADGSLTINVAGNYHFKALVQATAPMADNTNWNFVLCRKAGALPAIGEQIGQFNFTTGSAGNNYPTAQVAADQVCAVGDRIATYMWQSAAATNVDYTGFSVHRTGAGPKGDKGDTGSGTTIVPTPAYTVTGGATDRAFNASATTVNELANVLGSLINDLKANGVVG